MEKQPPLTAKNDAFAEPASADTAAKNPATFKSLLDQFYARMLPETFSDTTFETQAAKPFFTPSTK